MTKSISSSLGGNMASVRETAYRLLLLASLAAFATSTVSAQAPGTADSTHRPTNSTGDATRVRGEAETKPGNPTGTPTVEGTPQTTSVATAGSTSVAEPVFWPPPPMGFVYVDGSSQQEMGLVRAVVSPSKVTLAVNEIFNLGANPVQAYNGRGDRVSTIAIPHPGRNVYFEVFKNPAGGRDHTGHVDIGLQDHPTAQVYLVGRKPGKIVVRCFPTVNVNDGGRKIEVHLRHVFADIEVEVQ